MNYRRQDARRARRPGDARPCCPLTRRGGRRNCCPSRPHAIRTGPAGGPPGTAFLATMPLTGVADDVCGPRRATDPGGLRAAICQRAIPRHHQREPRMRLGRAHRHRRPSGLPARDDGRHLLAARCQGHPGAGRSMAPHRRGPGRRAAPPAVLHPRRPTRLSYTLDDPPGSPSVYVTWELRRTGDGTIIRLNVDEPWPLASSTEDLEDAWLPVLSGLVKHLEQGPASPSERTS